MHILERGAGLDAGMAWWLRGGGRGRVVAFACFPPLGLSLRRRPAIELGPLSLSR